MNSFDLIFNSLPLLIKAAGATIQLWLTCIVISLSCGILFGVLRSKNVRIFFISDLLDFITFILRGIPFYVQLLLAYFVFPDLLGINLSAFAAATGSLGICSAAYVSQVIRGGINSIAIGQWEAADVLGYTKFQTFRFIILPQVFKNVLPAVNGELDQLLKSTSIFSSIGVLELTRAGMNIISIDMQPIPIYLTIAVLYLMISCVLSLITNQIERRIS